MPTRSKSPRLWCRPEVRRRGKLIRRSAWFILDCGRQIATGCLADEAEAAQLKLDEYIIAKHRPSRQERDIEQIDIADVLAIYYDDTVSRQANANQLTSRISRLNEFWGAKKLSEVNGETCRAYADDRGNKGGSRRDLEDLRAAIEHHAKEGLHRGVVRVTLPPKGPARTRWLTRDEVARLVGVCWRYREVQTIHRGQRKGAKQETDWYPLRHLARFILFAVYTGTRPGAVLTAAINPGDGRAFVDVANGIFYRLAEGARETNIRQPPASLPPRLRAHLERWMRLGIVRDFLVEWHGKPIQSVKTGFAKALKLAAVKGKISPHTLRHTAATWLMQAGVDKWEVAGFLGMSVEKIDRVYSHHHPDHLRRAATALGYRQRQSLAVPLAVTRRPLAQQPEGIEKVGGGRSPDRTSLTLTETRFPITMGKYSIETRDLAPVRPVSTQLPAKSTLPVRKGQNPNGYFPRLLRESAA